MVIPYDQCYLVVNDEGEMSPFWPSRSHVFCRNSERAYVLVGNTFREILRESSKKIVRLTADRSTLSPLFVNCVGLSFPVLANRDYIVEGWILFSTVSVAVGIRLGLLGPSAPVAVAGDLIAGTTATGGIFRKFNTYDAIATVIPDVMPGNNLAVLRALVRNGINSGNVTLRFASEIAGSSVVVRTGSCLVYQRIN